MNINTTDQDLVNQITQDSLIYQTVNPGYKPLLLVEIDSSPANFATYALTNGLLTHFLPSPTSAGDPVGFVTQAFENALGRAPTAADLTYYEAVIADHPVNAEGYAVALTGIALSPESYAHNGHLI